MPIRRCLTPKHTNYHHLTTSNQVNKKNRSSGEKVGDAHIEHFLFTVLQTSNFYQRRRWQYPSDRFEHRFEHCAELSTGRLTITSNHKARHLSVGALTGTCTASILALRKATAFWRPLTARQVVGDTSTGQGTRSGWQKRPQHDKWD